MIALTCSLDRTVFIRARRETVFRFFTDTDRWASWWGAGSTIDARVGGALRILHPGGVETLGEVLEIVTPERIAFTYGFTSGNPIPVGASRVTIHLEPHRDGTILNLTHEFADAAARDEHVQGWRYQLSVFSNIVANEVNAHAADTIDAWFEAWSIADAQDRQTALAAIAVSEIEYRDRFSTISGLSDLTAQVGAVQRFMPQMRLQRQGPVRHCQGTALADWTAAAADGTPRGSGTNVFVLGPDARLTSVVGLWN
jgi:uncharacterized protein YndB with AHSA1/START domain